MFFQIIPNKIMKGIKPSCLPSGLGKVDQAHAGDPVKTLTDIHRRFGPKRAQVKAWLQGQDLAEALGGLPIHALRLLSFDDLCKLQYSNGIYGVDESVKKYFERVPRCYVVQKIASSIWRWSYGEKDWNELVDAYDCLRSIRMEGYPGFEVRLDHATYHNNCGYSRYSRTFLDGAFGLLIHYRGEHVLTIGFSVASKRRLLLQQVQSARRSGNRALFRLPANRVEFAIGLLSSHFPSHEIFVVDGESLADRILENYGESLSAQQRILGEDER
jgi:hypothetical protein